MSWLQDKLRTVTDAAASKPFECPRGWGNVSFHLEIGGFPPFLSFERKCPIGGVTTCDACRHPLNPHNIEQLQSSLAQLDELRRQGGVTDQEHATRRRLIVGLENHGEYRRREGFRITAWILGPLGVLLLAAGLWLSQVHAGFYGLLAGGAVMSGLTLSFAWLARATSSWDDHPGR